MEKKQFSIATETTEQLNIQSKEGQKISGNFSVLPKQNAAKRVSEYFFLTFKI